MHDIFFLANTFSVIKFCDSASIINDLRRNNDTFRHVAFIERNKSIKSNKLAGIPGVKPRAGSDSRPDRFQRSRNSAQLAHNEKIA